LVPAEIRENKLRKWTVEVILLWGRYLEDGANRRREARSWASRGFRVD
jgi:hypothetical protein